jgi:hypothetical protein
MPALSYISRTFSFTAATFIAEIMWTFQLKYPYVALDNNVTHTRAYSYIDAMFQDRQLGQQSERADGVRWQSCRAWPASLF